MSNWQVGKFLTIDELMIHYKGKRSLGTSQYITNKPCKWGFKVWSPSMSTAFTFIQL